MSERNFRFKIVNHKRVAKTGRIFKFDVRTPGLTLHNCFLKTGKAQPGLPAPDLHLDYVHGTKSEVFGVTFPVSVREEIRTAAIVALADWHAAHNQPYPPELGTTEERLRWLADRRESTRISEGGYVVVTDGLNVLEEDGEDQDES